MDIYLLILLAVFLCVAALVGGVVLIFSGHSSSQLESRLDMLTASGGAGMRKPVEESPSLLAGPLDETANLAEMAFSRFCGLRLLLDQADMKINATQFLAIMGGLVAVGTLGCFIAETPVWMLPLVTLPLASLPVLYAMLRRKRRMKAFARQLPDALELISRALRAGHSLAAGFQLVGQEMSDPIGREFTRCYEEQNLGVPLEEALDAMTDRVPNVDLRFFATAVILQRQTGGDLAEILDKIGSLIRERFKIWGQIQALTGEGRLSGIVLLALPPVLFVAMYQLNPDYCRTLFVDPLGQWMLGGAVLLQLLGALVIRKIINIKV